MSIFVGPNKATHYHGDHHPAELWGPDSGEKSLIRYSGFDILKASGKGRVEIGEQPYKASLPSVVVQGEGKQEQLTGKNLIPYPYLSNFGTFAGVTYKDLGDGRISAIGTASEYSAVYFARLDIIEILKGKIITLSGARANENIKIMFTLRAGTSALETFVAYEGSSATVNLSDYPTADFIKIEIARGIDGPVDAIVYPQIELGSDATPYEPYCGGIPAPNPQYPIEPVFLDGASITDGDNTAPIPILRALPDGSVRDEIDVVSGTVTRRIGVQEFDEEPQWSFYAPRSDKNFSCFYNPGIKLPSVTVPSSETMGACCNYSREISDNFAYLGNNTFTINRIQMPKCRLSSKIVGNSPRSFADWLKKVRLEGRPFTIWYPLATPIIEHYDPAILRQHPGYTQLIQQGGFKPAIIDAEYYEEVDY